MISGPWADEPRGTSAPIQYRVRPAGIPRPAGYLIPEATMNNDDLDATAAEGRNERGHSLAHYRRTARAFA